ncbi:hypothetical protein ATANTOWER_021659 [Ataeniobius toweri]|uniref:Uncharacterized protein n=1 Tax=Ataeniobius toweri TaxID=208326 RepID=A0ABU7BAM7_9TELE|nr:hypothetical protein [Ataeniobius toweri]
MSRGGSTNPTDKLQLLISFLMPHQTELNPRLLCVKTFGPRPPGPTSHPQLTTPPFLCPVLLVFTALSLWSLQEVVNQVLQKMLFLLSYLKRFSSLRPLLF